MRTKTMSNITLANLTAAVVSTSRTGATPFHAMTVEEARGQVKVKDGNRKPAEDGSQVLTVVIGKHTISSSAISTGATRIGVTADQVEDYTAALQDAINEGLFDEGIAEAQVKAKVQAEKPRTARTKSAPVVVVEETEGLDIDALEEEDEFGDIDA